MSLFYVIMSVCLASIAVGYAIAIRRKEQISNLAPIDYVAEGQNVPGYINQLLSGDLSFLDKEVDLPQVDAIMYAENVNTFGRTMKSFTKSLLKSLATLGTIRYIPVQTQKILILSNSDLHLIDLDTNQSVSSHFIFNASRLTRSQIIEMRTRRGVLRDMNTGIKTYKISLNTDRKPVELLLYSSLIKAGAGGPNRAAQTLAFQKTFVRDKVLGRDFLLKLGERYENLKVAL